MKRSILLAAILVAPMLNSCAAMRQHTGSLFRPVEDLGNSITKVGEGAADIVDTLANPASENLDADQEYYLGRAVTAELLGRYGNRLVGVEGTGKDAEGTAQLLYVQSIAAAIAEAGRVSDPTKDKKKAHERHPTTLRVALVVDEIPNAYATPGGFAVVTTGMLDLAQSEDELAAVLAHEMSHVNLAHGLAAIDDGRLKGGIKKMGEGLSEAAGAEGLVAELAAKFGGMVGDITGKLIGGYPEKWEYAADARALDTLQAAGYSPGALEKVLGRLDAWQKDHNKEGIAGTHPDSQDRIKRVRGAAQVKVPPKALAVRSARFQENVPVLLEAAAEDPATRTAMR